MTLADPRILIRERARAELDRRRALMDQKAAAEESLMEFVRLMWPVIEPTTPLIEGWVLELLCEALTAVTDGHVLKEIINVPPGFSKSLMLNVFWPAWEWGPQNRPGLRYLSASYNSSLAERDNGGEVGRFSRLIKSGIYQHLWGNRFRILKDNAGLVENDKTGWKRVVTPGGGTTGHRGDRILCLPFDCPILTNIGWVRIGDVVRHELPVRIAGWNGTAVEWQDIEAYETNPASEIVAVEYDGGSLRCTPDHPIWVEGRGYVPAADVQPGDAVLQVVSELWRTVPMQTVASGQEFLLLQEVPAHKEGGGSAGAEHASLRGVRETVLSRAVASRSSRTQFLQPDVSGRGECRSGQSSVSWRPHRTDVPVVQQTLHGKAGRGGQSRDVLEVMSGKPAVGEQREAPHRASLSAVRKRVHAAQQKLEILLQAMCRDGAQQADVGFGQRSLQARQAGASHRLADGWKASIVSLVRNLRGRIQAAKQAVTLLFFGMSAQAPGNRGQRSTKRPVCARAGELPLSGRMDAQLPQNDQSEGRSCVPALRSDASGACQGSPCSPHRLREGEPGPAQPDHALQDVPRQDAREATGARSVARRVVRAVTRLPGIEPVTFNLRVGPHHNYFAAGILTHNCDDLNNPADVESDTVRESTKTWVREVMPSRVNSAETSAIINVQQRTHEEDATGVLAKVWDDVTWICIPMHYDPLRDNPVTLSYDDDGEPDYVWQDPRGIDEDGNRLEGLVTDARGKVSIRPGSPMAQAEGTLAWPERFGQKWCDEQQKMLGAYAYNGQYGQSPGVRGGGIIRRDWWLPWDGAYPDLGTVIASLDTAYEEGKDNDYNALTTWGAFPGPEGEPRLIMTSAWRGRCKLADLVKTVHDICVHRKVDYLLVEKKTRGRDVHDEILRLYANATWTTVLIEPKGTKVSRLHAVSHLFSGDATRDPVTAIESYTGGVVHAPDRDWADEVIDEVTAFPFGAHDDWTDTVSQALGFVRKNGVVLRKVEWDDAERERKIFRKRPSVPYAIKR